MFGKWFGVAGRLREKGGQFIEKLGQRHMPLYTLVLQNYLRSVIINGIPCGELEIHLYYPSSSTWCQNLRTIPSSTSLIAVVATSREKIINRHCTSIIADKPARLGIWKGARKSSDLLRRISPTGRQLRLCVVLSFGLDAGSPELSRYMEKFLSSWCRMLFFF